MNARQLQIFVAVAEHLNFSQAAQSLHIAQSAVSIAIKKLEAELDTKLFQRSMRNIQLTSAGQVLLEHASRITQQFADAKLEMLELKQLHHGKISIAMPAMYAAYYFPDIISDFMAQYPQLSIAVKEEGTTEVMQDLLNGDIDLGVITLENCPEELDFVPLVDEEIVACVAPDHPFANKKKLSYKAFFTQPLILVSRAYFLRRRIDDIAKQLNIESNIVFETNLMRLIKKLVLSGIGIGICLRFVLRDEQQLKGIPLNPPVFFQLGLAWRKDRYLSAANQSFVNFFRETANTIAQPE